MPKTIGESTRRELVAAYQWQHDMCLVEAAGIRLFGGNRADAFAALVMASLWRKRLQWALAVCD